MRSVTAVAVSAHRVVPGLDVCPPVQENLDGPKVAFLSSIVEGSTSTLLETQKENKIMQINGTKILITPHIHSYFNIFLHICYILNRV